MKRYNVVIATDEALLAQLREFGLTDKQISSLPVSTSGLKVIPNAGDMSWFPVHFHPGAMGGDGFANTVLAALQYYEKKEEKELTLKAARHLANVAAASKDEVLVSAASLFRDIDSGY